jgi:hypothetical protein
MRKLRLKLWVVAGLLILLGQSIAIRAAPMGTAFTYQGRLIDANSSADGLYDLQFRLFDVNVAGTKKGSTIDVNELDVIDGYFTVRLDFGGDPNIFNGQERWLEIGIRPGELNDPNEYNILSPRQKITPTPYALYAMSSGSTADSDWIITGNNMYSGVPGNVGIGTDSPAGKLDVRGTIVIEQNQNPVIFTGTGTSELNRYVALLNSPDYSSASGLKAGGVLVSDSYEYANPGKNDLIVKGNVGVGSGITAPGERFDLSWSGGVNARIGKYNYLGSCFSSATFVLGNNVRARTDSVNGIVVGNQHETYGYRAITMSMDGIKFYGCTGAVKVDDPLDTATERMRITNDGKVGIGTTSPMTVFDVHGGRIRASSGFESIFGTAGDVGVGFISDNDTGMFHPTWADNSLAFSTAGAERMRIVARGWVGIGTTDPDRSLDVSSPNQAQIALHGTDPNGYGGLVIWNDLGRFGYVGIGGSNFVLTPTRNSLFLCSPDQGDIVFQAPIGSTRAIMKANGNVGIGTLLPSGKLDVNGSIYQRGSILHADYVFESNYKLESIDEHSVAMWREKHLPAVPKAQRDETGQEIVEIGAQNKGVVEELEKAHIYIEQLNKRITILEERLAKLEASSTAKEVQ